METVYKPDRWAHRRAEPRMFAAVWAFYLLGACAACVGVTGSMGLIAGDVYRPAIRMVMVVAGAGLGLAWPLVRLSQSAPQRPLRDGVMDTVVVLGPLLALIWPQGFAWMAAWPWPSVAMLSASMSAWALLVAGLLTLYFEHAAPEEGRPGRLSRSGAMLAFVLITLGGPGIALLLPHQQEGAGSAASGAWLQTSPAGAAFEIVRDRSWSGSSALLLPRHAWAVTLTGLVAVAVWLIAMITVRPRLPDGSLRRTI